MREEMVLAGLMRRIIAESENGIGCVLVESGSVLIDSARVNISLAEQALLERLLGEASLLRGER